MRTLERVESLENVAKWSYRQPKKQRNLGGLTKTHWDYLLDEMVRILICLSYICHFPFSWASIVLDIEQMTGLILTTEMDACRFPGRAQMEIRSCL